LISPAAWPWTCSSTSTASIRSAVPAVAIDVLSGQAISRNPDGVSAL
jgi:hypothetical protein